MFGVFFNHSLLYFVESGSLSIPRTQHNQLHWGCGYMLPYLPIYRGARDPNCGSCASRTVPTEPSPQPFFLGSDGNWISDLLMYIHA